MKKQENVIHQEKRNITEKQPHEDQQDGIHISIIPTMKPVLYND